MVALLAGKGLALAAGKPLIAVNHLEGHALSPRLVDPDLGFPYLLLLVSGGHCQLLEVRGVGDYRRLATTIDDAAGEAFDKAAKLLGLGYPGRPGDRGSWRKSGDPDRGPAAAPAGRLGRTAFLLRRASRAPCSARSPRASIEPEDIAASFQQAVVDCLVDRTAPRASAKRRARPGRRRRSRRQSGRSASALADLAQREGPPLQRPAGLAVHRQCGDDRLGRGRALRRRPDRRPRRAGARALAARRKRGEGPRRGGQGMKLGVIGGGAWGTALAQVAAAGGRETLLWALEDEVVEAVNARPRKPGLSCRACRSTRRSARPRDFSDLDDCDAWLVVTPAQHMRAVLEQAPCLRHAAGPLLEGDRGRQRASCSTRSRARSARQRRSRCCPARPSRMKSRAGLPTAVTLAAEDAALAEQLRDRIALPDFPHLRLRRCRRRGDRRRGQERARDRLRRGRGQGPRPERARRADRAAALPK